MQTTNILESLAPAPVETPKQNAGDLGLDEFLTMLIAQLENQDPLNPQEATEFSAQLAQFSSLEQLINVRTAVDGLAASQVGSASSTVGLQAIGLVGRQVLAEGSHFELGAEGSVPLRFEQDGATSSTVVRVFGPNGNEVRRYELGSEPAGAGRIEWDGIGNNGNRLPAGTYSFSLDTLNESSIVDSRTLVAGRVTAATLSGPEPVLHIGSTTVPLAQVREVREDGGFE